MDKLTEMFLCQKHKTFNWLPHKPLFLLCALNPQRPACNTIRQCGEWSNRMEVGGSRPCRVQIEKRMA